MPMEILNVNQPNVCTLSKIQVKSYLAFSLVYFAKRIEEWGLVFLGIEDERLKIEVCTNALNCGIYTNLNGF